MSNRRAARLLDLTRPYGRDDLVLGGEKLGVQLGDAVQSLVAERTMDGASTLTMGILDPSFALLDERELLGRRQLRSGLTLEVDGLGFRLMELEKRRFGFEAVFYDEPSARMKLTRGALKASRDAMTRPQFVAWMCRKAGVASYIPQIRERPLIADLEDDDLKALRAAKSTTARQERSSGRAAKGSLRNAKGLKVKGEDATSEQRRNMEDVLRACDTEDAPPKARLACVLAPIGESSYLRDNPNPRSTANGVFQLLDTTAREYGLDKRDTYACARQFLRGGFTGGKGTDRGAIALAKANPGISAGALVKMVEGSDASGGGFYDAYRDEALRILDAWSPSDEDPYDSRTGSPDRAYVETYEFRVEADEDYLEAAARLADETRWRTFSTLTAIAYADDRKLAEATPTVELEEGRGGCDEITWSWTARERIDEAVATVRLARWLAPPGAVVNVRDQGPASGRHLVRFITRDLLDEGCTASITLGRPQDPLPEPASTVRTVQGTAASASSSSSGGDRKVDEAYSAAERISRRGYPYVWGGGHAKAGTPDGGIAGGPGGGIGLTGYDCSGYVVAVLAAAGLGFKEGKPGTNSTGLMSWGEPGRGKYLTVWSNPAHTFIEFTIDGKRGRWADTSREGAPPNDRGPRLRSGNRSTAGFTPRHWAGT